MSKWRETYKVHPAADVFPMMSDEELQKLGEDIKANGLKHPIILQHTNGNDEDILLDGRNRLEAMERAGISIYLDKHYLQGDPVAHIIGLNIHRRHLTKQQQADLIVAAHKAAEAPRQLGEMPKRHSKGKAGSEKDTTKAAAVETAKAHGIGKRTVERSFAKAARQPSRHTPRPMPKPRSGKPTIGLEAARRCYLDLCAGPDVDLDAEQEIIIDALREIAGKKAMSANADDLELPAFLDRKRSQAMA